MCGCDGEFGLLLLFGFFDLGWVGGGGVREGQEGKDVRIERACIGKGVWWGWFFLVGLVCKVLCFWMIWPFSMTGSGSSEYEEIRSMTMHVSLDMTECMDLS